MLYRTLAVATLTIAALAGAACNRNNDARNESNDTYAKSTSGRNLNCPMCGMAADARYSVNQEGISAACCSQACRDKFNKSSAADKRTLMNNANKGVSSSSVTRYEDGRMANVDARNDGAYTATSNQAPTATQSNVKMQSNTNNTAVLNRTCPITGKSVSDKFVAEADGQRVAFSSQEALDQYMSYGPEHRAEVRAKIQQ